jgi:hypothetical protein
MQMLVAQPPDRPTLCGATPKVGVKCCGSNEYWICLARVVNDYLLCR